MNTAPAAAIVALAAAAIYLPHIVDRAIRNRRTRQARTQARECHANHWQDSSEPLDAWMPVDVDFARWEQELEGSA